MSDLSNTPQTALTFVLDGETFGVDVARVEEIVDPLPMTRAPNADPFAPALVNVRGSIVPVVDLRHRLGMAAAEQRPSSRLLVLNVLVDGEPTRVALMADDVDAIVETTAAEIEAVPELGLRWPAKYFRGVARKNGVLVILLDEQTTFPPQAA
ncbi:chemotaxis protein CheW [Roseitranquillus sediminis]|uniref:chemotaxis protein CheW n=1 Tax=Roseitranquillus sediminis TaxID=2809051 RepID=UPI001D0C1453|nr:chemotaxis protein CheW [Roseitranquillus sediminis]MBM9593599.1 chemotaxis protein CheW [Roseitranquillus sediminis]